MNDDKRAEHKQVDEDMVNDKKVDESKANGKRTGNNPRLSSSDNTNGKKAEELLARKDYVARALASSTLQTR